MKRLFELRRQCLGEPTVCEPSSYSRQGYLERDRLFVQEMIDRKAHLRTAIDDPSYVVVSSLEPGASASAMSVVACVWDTDILAGVGGGVFNDLKVSSQSQFGLVLEGEAWFIASVVELTRTERSNTCPARA